MRAQSIAGFVVVHPVAVIVNDPCRPSCTAAAVNEQAVLIGLAKPKAANPTLNPLATPLNRIQSAICIERCGDLIPKQRAPVRKLASPGERQRNTVKHRRTPLIF
jgi:hypothetical protein